jgi:hypothetical protein
MPDCVPAAPVQLTVHSIVFSLGFGRAARCENAEFFTKFRHRRTGDAATHKKIFYT